MPDRSARRAAPLPAEERRAAILAATIPLLREQGARVSTRELAAAAGVAEGTLFRVFPDKRALLCAAVKQATDPEPFLAELAAIDRSAPLDRRIEQVTTLLLARMDGIVLLVSALHDLPRDESDRHPRAPHRPDEHGEHAERVARILRGIADVVEPDAAALPVPPVQAAGLMYAVAFGDRMPGLPEEARLAAPDLAACLARGLDRSPPDGEPPSAYPPAPATPDHA